MTSILVVDNYDSFVYTIVGYVQQLGAACTVVRNDAVDLDAVPAHDGVLVSPGPGTPEEAGATLDVIGACATHGVPMLGVCLGHQGLAVAFGGRVGRAPELRHGKTSPIEHDGTGLLAGLPSPLTATRYHSLAVERHSLPGELVVNAWTESGIVMGIRHARLPLHGLQFHPESVLTEGGHRMLGTWLALAGQPEAVRAAAGLAPLVRGAG